MYNLVWYNTLNKPFLTPPAWIFAPMWTVLYLLIFLAVVIFGFKKTEKSKLWGYVLFFSQLGLNMIWSPVFFYMHNMGLAFVIIILMLVLVLWNISEFFKVSRLSAYLLMPYLIWLIYAAYLNAGFYILN